jgi:hypothetical protein
VDNLWDEIDNDGYLCGARCTAQVITESGSVGNLPMPISVQVADLNGDGLLDIFTIDADGYFRAYFNSGTKAECKFTHW